ncbi:hypothetical protein [Actinophytocola sp. KF-1]
MRLLVVVVALLAVGCGTHEAHDAATPERVVLRGLTVDSVPADTGFWAIGHRDERIWVKLRLPGRSAMPVQPGERVDVTGLVVPHGPDFAGREGVTAGRDADLLTRLGEHVEVEQADVRVVAAPHGPDAYRT